MKFELPNPENGKIVSIEVARKNKHQRALEKTCTHGRVHVDTLLAYLIYQDCGAHINPAEWLAMFTEEWHRIQSMYEKYLKEKELYMQRHRVKCIHCQKFTPVR